MTAPQTAPPPSSSETFTGRSLEEMTLAQKLCELREDRLRVLGLEQSFRDNLRDFGLGFALDSWLERARLRRSGTLDEALADYRRQIAADVAAIERDQGAQGDGGYRARPLAADVARVLERFGQERDRHALGDLRTYVAIHREELARELRALALEAQHPHPGFGRLGARAKVWLVDHRRPVGVLGTAALLGALGWLVAYGVLQRQNRNRPTLELAEMVESDHPCVEAAARVHDATAAANRLVNVYLGAELGASTDVLLPLHDAAADRASRAAREADDAHTLLARGQRSAERIRAEGEAILGAWSHTSYRSTSSQTTCTTRQDSQGKSVEECTTTTTCDYVDHTWRVQPDFVRNALQNLRTYAPTIKPLPYVVPATLQAPLAERVKGSPEYQRAKPQRRAELLERADDWLASRLLVGTGDLSHGQRLFRDGFAERGLLRWLADNVDNRSSFPLVSTDRDYSCGDGSPPKAYVVSYAAGTEAKHVGELQADLLARTKEAAQVSRELGRRVSSLADALRAGRAPRTLHDDYDVVGELAVRLQKVIHPSSRFQMLSKGWRIAVPLLALAGLAVTGALGGWLVVRALERRGYHRRMVQRGLA